MTMRCILIALLLLSINFRSTVVAASSASSGKISALSPVSVQGMDAITGITRAEPRKLARGGGSGGGGRGGGSSGGWRGWGSRGGGRGGGSRGGGRGEGSSGGGRGRNDGDSVAARGSQCLGMTTLTVLATSFVAILLL